MNKIFKVIWSKSKQCYIVVSEIAKNKTGKKKVVVAGIFAALALIGGIQSVEAANTSGSGSSNAVAWGTGSNAPGDNAIAIGKGANAVKNNTIAIGTSSKANLDMAVAVGNEASADTHGTSIGANAKTTGYGAFAGGVNAQANGVGAIAIGGATSDAYNQNAVANGESAVAIGSSAIASDRGGVAVGWNAESKVNAVGIGFNAKAKANNAVAIGVEANNDKANAISNNYSSVSVGVATRARAVGSMAMGVSADASGNYSIALGSGDVRGDYTNNANYPKATGEKAIAIGYNSNSSNTGATAIGAGATASGTDSFAGGSGTAGGNSSIAIGKSSGATNDRALAVGVNAKATGKDSVAVGSGAGGTVGLGFASRIDENTGVVQTIRNINVATTADGDNAVAVGHYANAMNSGVALGQNTLAATGGVAIGKGVFEDTNNVKAGGTVIGQDSTVTGLYSLAVGRYTFASGSTSMAMGYDASAKGNYAVAMGRKVIADGTSTAIGHHAVATNGGLAIGSQDNDASKDKTTASASGAVAIGKNTQSTLKGAVALGSDSTTATSATKQESVTINGITYNFSGATSDTGMQVSVGAAGKERQIKNVAAGEVSATSTDAINGSQLFAVASQIKPINYISVKSSAVGNKNNAGATGADAVAIGPGAQSSGDNGVSLGNGSQANAESVVSIGYQSNYGAQNNSKSIGIGWAAGYQSNGSENIGIGRDAGRKLTGSNNVSIGKSAGSGDVYTSGSVLLGQSATIINSTSATPINDVVAIGNGAQGGAASSVAIGTGAIAKVKDSVAIGSGSKATVDKGAKGYDPNENRTNKYGGLTNNILTSTNAAVSVGEGASVTRQITGVAAGTNNTDAVNVAQLKSVNLAFSGNNTDTTGDVNLANGTLAIKGDTTYITTTANTNGITIAGKTQDISVNANGVASANKGMADAKNVAQSINDAISKSAYTWTVSANGDAGESVAKGNKVDFNGDSSNITVERAGKKITTKLNKDITVDSVKANNKVTVGTAAKQLVLDGTTGVMTVGIGTNVIKLDGTSATITAGSGNNAISLNGTNAQAAFGSGTNSVSINGKTGAVTGQIFTAGNTTINTNGLTSGTGSRTVLFGTNGISAGDQVINNVATGGSKDSNAANIGDVKRYVSGATLNLTDGANNKGSVQLGDQSLKVTTGTGLNATVSGQTVNIGLTTDAQNAISNGIGLLGNVGSTGIKKLKEGNVAFDIKGDGSVVKTTASNSGVTIAVDTDKLAANTNLAYTANGASTAKNVALSKGLNFVNGSNTIAIVNDDGKVSFDLNAATKNQINTNTTGVAANKASIATNASDIATNKNKIATNTTDIAANKSKIATNTTNIAANTTALARNISLGADSGAKSSQSLSTTDVAFNVKGATGDFISTKMNGNTVEVSTKRSTINSDTNSGAASVTGADGLVTAKNVADAINKAADAAKAGAAWNLTTNSSTTDKTTVKGGDTVNLVNGDNIVITQDGTDKKKITIATKKNLMVDSVTAGNTVINTSGLTNGTTVITGTGVTTDKVTVGGLSIDKTAGINAGGKVISNVASGNVNNNATDDTNAATIGDVKTAVNGLSQNLNISDGTKDSSVALKSQKLTVTGTGAAKATVNNQTITVDVAEGTLTPNTTNGTVTGTTGVAKATEVAAAINNTNTVLGNKIAKNTQDIATNTSNITANKNQITTNTTNIATNTANIAHTIALADDKGASTTAKSLKNGNVSFNIKGDNKYISTAASGNDVTLTVNEQAIKDVAKSTSSFKVKANTHAEEDVKGGDTIAFNNGDNIEISQTGKTFTIGTAKNITVDSVTAGNTVINTSGLTNGTTAITGTGITTDKVTVGGISIDKTAGINAGGKVISNVASGTVNNNATDNSNAANIGDVKQAVANLSQNLNITDGTNNGTVDLKNQNLNVAGANGVTATVNNQTITVGLDADTVNATTKGIGLTGDTGSTGNKYLKDGDVSLAVTGDGNLVSTTATTAGVKVAVDAAKVKDLAVSAVTVSKDAQADNPITVTPTASTNSKDYAIGIDTTKLAAKTDLTYRANSVADANAKKVSLSKGLNFVDGDSTVATVDNDGKVSFDLNTTTKNQINTNTTDIATNKGKIATNTTNIAANTTALARNISLGAEAGTASSQSLSTADVAFNVKGATGDFVSTNMNGNTVEISTKRATINNNATTGEASVTGNDGLATAQNVADAINKAADAAKAGAAWNITTNSSTTDKTTVKGGDTVNLVNGDNIEITQDGTDKKKITVATKKDITVDSVTANNKVTVGSGANKITLDGTDGSVTGKAFTGTTFTGTSFTGTSFTAGNTVINTNGLTNGTTAITGTGVTTDNVTVGDISIDKTTGINAGNKVISNVASGGTTATNAANIGDVQNAVANLSQNLNITDGTNNGTVDLKNQKLNVAGANGVTAIVNNQTITVGLDADTVNATTKGIGLTADNGSTGNKYLKDGDVSFAVTGDGSLVSTTATTAGVKVAVNSATITAGTDGTITGPTTDGVATAKNVADAINAAKKASKTEITANTGEAANATTGNVTLTSTTAADGHTIYDVKLNDKVTLGTGANAVTIDGTTGAITGKTATIGGVTVNGTANTIGGLSNTTWNGTAVSGRAATEDQLKAATGATTLKFTGDVATNTGSVNLKDDTFGIKGDGKYISTDANGKNLTVKVSEAEVKKSAVAAVTVSTDTTDTDNPLTVTPNASADGTTKDYKVTIDGTKIANKTNLSYKANDGTAKQVSLADGLNFKNGTLTTASIDDNGVVKYDINTASITAGTDGTITGPTTDGVATAQNVADAINAAKKASKTEITANTGEAANATTGNVTLTSTTAADGHTIYDVKLNDKVTLGTGANAVTIDGTTGAITGKTANIGGVTVNGTANTIGGLSNTTWNGTATTGRAATEDQLKVVADAAGSQTWNITADKAGTTGNQTGTKKNATVGKDETVELVAGDNLTINQNERKFTYSLNKDLANLTSVSVGTGTTETIKLDGATGKITAKNASIGGVTIDGDNNHVTGLANTTWNGTATTGRAATEDQLKAVADTAKTTTDAVNLKFSGDTNTSPGVVNLKDDTLGIIGDGKYVSTDANGKNLTVKVSEVEVKKSAVSAVTVSTDTTDTNNPLTVTPTTSADGTTKNYKVTIDGTKIANKTNLSYKANDGTAKQVSLADGLNFKNGTLTTASIDDNGVVKYDVNTATITAGADGTITGPTTDGVATAQNVADAINAAKKASTTEITANTGEAANATTGNVTLTSTTAADGHTIYDVKLNDKVTLGTGANAVTVDGTAGKATIGSSIVDGVNNTFTTGGASPVTLNGATGTITGKTANIGGVTVNGTANTIGGLSNTTWNGTATTGQAATEDQLKAVADAAGSQTWEITADKKAGTSGVQTGTKENAKVGKDDKVSLIAGENLTVDQAGKNLTYSLNKDLVKMNSATFLGTGTNTTVITGDSITQTAGTQTNTSTAAGNTVANGTKSTETTATGQVIKDGTKTNTSTVDENTIVDGAKSNKSTVDNNVIDDGTGNVNTSNATSNTITDGTNTSTITAGKATIGSSIIDGVNKTFTTGGNNAVTMNGAAGTIKTGAVTVTGGTTNDITGLSNTTVTGADFATKGRAATEEQLKAATGATTLKFTGDVVANTGSVNLKDDTFGIKGDGKYVSTDTNGKNLIVKVSEAEVKKSAVAAVTVSTDTTDTDNPLTVTPNASADGTTKDYKVTIDGTKIANKTNLSYKANDGTAKQVSLADGLNFKNGTLTTASIDDNGVVKYDVNTATITAGADGTITGPTTDGVATAQNVADAINAAKKASTTEITANTGEAANATTGNVTLTSTTAADGHTIYDVKLNDKVTLGTGANAVTVDGTAGKATIGSSIVDGVNNTFTTGGASPVTLNGATGTITGKTANIGGVTVDGTNNHVMGLANKDWTPGVTQAVSGRAATEDQLQKVSDAVGAGWKVNTGKVTGSTGESNGAASTKVASGEEVQFQAGNNLIVDQNGKTVAYSLNKALKDMESATFNGTGTNNTVITGDSITQTAGTRTNTATAAGQVIKDGTKTNTSTVDENTIVDGTKSNKSTVDGNTITDGTNTTATTSNSVTVKDNAGNSTVITKDNVTTGVGGNKITLDGTAGKATIGSSIVDGVNNTFTTGGINAVTMNGAAGTIKTGTVTVTGGTTNDITGLSNTTVNSADFATKGRAATEEQLKAVGEQTWQITADKDRTTSGAQTGTKKDAKVGKDNKVQLIAGENMTINQNERDFTFTLNKDLVKMNSATFLGTGSNTTVITGNSITQTAGTQTNTFTAGGNTVADGTKSTETTATGQVIKDGNKSNKSTVDSNIIDDGNGNKNTSNATSNTITDGTNTSTITAGKANIGNIAVDGVNNKITMGNGATPVTLDGANGHLDGLTNTTWVPGVTKATTGRAATEDQLQQVSDAVGAGWKVNTGTVAGSSGVSNGAASTKVSSGEEVKLQAGDNLVIDQNGKTVSYSLNKDLTKMNSATFEATGGKTTVIKGDSIVQTDGGKTNTSNAAGNTVVDGNKSTATTAAGTTITDGAKTNISTADKNVIDDGAGNKSTFTKDGITITKAGKDTVSLTSNGLDNGKNKIVNVAAGVANTDAVNVGQLKEYAAKSTTELTANNGETAGSTTGNIVLTKTTAADGHTIYDNKLNDKITLGTDPTKAVTVDGTTGTVTGLTNKTWTPGSIVSGRAATEDQLKDAVADSGWKVAVGKEDSGQSTVVGTSPEKIKAEETVTFKAGNNMMVTQTGKSISYAVNPELTNMTSATFKDAAGNTTVTNSNGITITPGSANPTNPHAGPVSLTKDGLNNGNNQIKGVAPGTDPTDAVNVAQLNASNTNTSQAINQIAGEVQHVGAHAAAMAALKPIQYDPLEPTQVMAGVGNYRGETAAALGLAHYTNENTMFNVGVSVGGNHNMVNAGVTHKFGYSPEKKNIPDRYKAGPISSVYVMQDEVSSLKKENAEQKYVIADQAARLTTLEAENEQQRRELAETKKGLDDLKAAVDKLLASKG